MTRLVRQLLSGAALAAAAVVAGTATAADAGAQLVAARFEIAAVGDSTFRFRVGSAGWVSPGQAGLAVDPRRRDVLVARFRVLDVREGTAVALITGQTTRLTTDHVAVLERPSAPFWRQRGFVVGLVLGGAIGAIAASQ